MGKNAHHNKMVILRSSCLITAGIVSCMLFSPVLAPRRNPGNHGNGLFSWGGSALSSENLFDRMERLGLTELYQHFPEDADPKLVESFLNEADSRGIDVYFLTGDPSWGLDSDGKAMLKEVDRAAAMPDTLSGIMMDTEPYLTDKWEEDPEEVMEDYVAAMAKARRAAERAGMEFVACIPYFYDTKGQTELLEKLTKDGCHALAVMNYDKKNEAANIETEADLAVQYKRPLITIYELQEPGKHELTKRNTYYHDGLSAVTDSWEQLRAHYPKLAFSYALHDYRALREVLANE